MRGCTLKKTLILGYGNPDREDDGVSWHIMTMICEKLGRKAPATYQEEFPVSEQSPDFLFALQLTPEFAETLANYQRVCFVDAHTGSVPNDVNFIEITPEFQSSPFTHHMTPSTCLVLAESLYGAAPKAVLASVRGYQFGFNHTLSPNTQAHAKEAADIIFDWLKSED